MFERSESLTYNSFTCEESQINMFLTSSLKDLEYPVIQLSIVNDEAWC